MPDKENKEMVEGQMQMAKQTYENLVEEHGFVRGTIKYYKNLFSGGT